MKKKELAADDYESFFDTLSKGMKDEQVEIEILAVGLFDKEETRWITIYGISYDPAEKTASIICDQIEHLIKNPQGVNVFEDDSGVESIEIIGGGGYKHLLRFKKPIKI